MGLAWATRGTEAAEVQSQDAEASLEESVGLLFPTFLVELAAVGEDDGTVAVAVEVGEDEAAVIGGERGGFLFLCTESSG
jgi:hypothetical protein